MKSHQIGRALRGLYNRRGVLILPLLLILGCMDSSVNEGMDVLMPSIATCQQCHKPGRGAESRCFECHEYHDWAAAKPVSPNFRVNQLVN